MKQKPAIGQTIYSLNTGYAARGGPNLSLEDLRKINDILEARQ